MSSAAIETSRPAITNNVRTVVAIRSCDCGIQGPESLILALAAAFQQQGLRYVIVNLWDGTPPTVALHQEAIRRGLESHVVATGFSLDPAILPKLTVLLRRLKPDVIHTHDFKSEMTTLIANRFVGAPLIGSYYGSLAIRSLFLKFTDVSRFVAFRGYRRLLANSSVQQTELRRWRIAERKLTIVPSFTDTSAITPPTATQRAAARAKLDINASQPVLATVARLSPNKGHRYMLEALAGIRATQPDVLYLIPGEGDMDWHGDGGLRGELERQVDALGLRNNVRFLGYYPDLLTILHATDMVVSPSLREGMQVSLLEAMAAGRPIVATAIGGTPDAIEDGVCGLLVPPADPQALAGAVLRLLNAPTLMDQLGAAARHRVATRFDVNVVAEQVLGICGEALYSTSLTANEK